MVKRLINFIDKNKILSKHQYMVSDATGQQNLPYLILLIKLLKQSRKGSSLLVSLLIYQKRLTQLITRY